MGARPRIEVVGPGWRLRRSLLGHLVPLVLVAALVLGTWFFLVWLGLWQPYLFAGPSETGRALRVLAGDGRLARALGTSLYRLALGFGLALMLGATLALAIVQFRFLSRGLQPYILGLQTFPAIAWVPLSLLWFGFSEAALLFVTLMGSVFAVTIAFVDALRTVPPTLLRAARNMGCEGFDLTVHVSIPASLPHLISAVKTGWSFAWRSLIGAEIVFATAGLGFVLNQGREFVDTAQVFGMMLVILALGVVFDRLVFSWLQDAVARRWGLATHR